MKTLSLSILLVLTSTLAVLGQNSDFDIKLKTGILTLDSATDFDEVLAPQLKEASAYHLYRIIQFESIPTAQEKKNIERLGIELLSYIPNKAFYAKLSKTISKSDLADLNVRAIFNIDQQLKISPRLKENKMPEWAVNGKDIYVNVKYFSKSDRQILIDQIVEQHGEVMFELEKTNMMTVQYKLDQLEELAKIPSVQWIEPISPPSTPDSIEGQSSSRSNGLNTNFGAGRKYDGSGVALGVSDDGVVGPHIDFTGRITQHTIENAGKHGDMCSGILVGAGNLDPTIQGMAPGAEIHIYRIGTFIFLSSQFHILEAVENLNNLGLAITSTSYSQGFGGEYNESTEFIDQQINETGALTHVFAAGNSGLQDHDYGAGPGWGNISGGMKAGKNVICAGNVDTNDELHTTSSRGPAADGRIKPDLCALGQGHLSTDERNTFQTGVGTSAATPTIAGVIAQLYQAYRELNNGENPESGFIKATLLNTAEDLGNPGPDFEYGWGRINGLKAVRIIENESYVNEEIGQGETKSHMISVPDNVSQVRIMTYWTDVQANPSAAVALVNDINMNVVSPDARSYDPWVLDPTPSAATLAAPATQGIDNLNNMEQVTIDNPMAGDYTVNLDGFSIPQGPQEYFVVYDFIYNEVELTYPIGGEGFVPGETETIRWDAPRGTDNFFLEYSADGGNSYSNIGSRPAGSRSLSWTVPNIQSNEVKIRITSGNSVGENNANFTIVDVPENLSIVRVCPDYIELSWDAVSGVSEYEISMLGEKYMDSIGIAETNSFNVTGLYPNDDHWFSVRALISDGKGRRAIAVNKLPGSRDCELQNDLKMTEILSSLEVVSSCKDLGNTEIAINVTNRGMQPESGVNVNYQIDNQAVVTEPLPMDLQVGESIDFVFATLADLTVENRGEISTWVTLSGDEDLSNDTLTSSYQVLSNTLISDFPHTEDFQSFSECSTSNSCEQTECLLSSGWNNYINYQDDEIDWRTDSGGTSTSNTGPPADYDDGTETGKYLYLEGTSCTFREAILLTPCLDLTSMENADVEFAYHMFGTGIGELHVDIITEKGEIVDIVEPIIGAQENNWRLLTIDLTPYVGGIVNLKIRGINGSASRGDMAIDAFTFNATPDPTSTDNIEAHRSGIVIYPNPTSGEFTIKTPQQLLKKDLQVEVVDLLGRSYSNSVLINSSKQLLNISDLASGIFFVKISGDNFKYSKRLIKI